MFKNKKWLYILVPLNILVWGFIGYKIYSAFAEEDLSFLKEEVQTMKLDDLKDSVNYKLRLNYEDPFLRKEEKIVIHSEFNSRSNSNNNSKNNSNSNSVKTPSIVTIKPQTEIKYLGLVKNSKTGIITALVSINGKSHLVKKGDLVEGIKIKNISEEIIEVKDGKNTMSIGKN